MLYIFENIVEIGQLSLQHLQFVGISILIAIILAVPQSLLIWKIAWLRVPLLGLMGVFYTIPSLALMILLVPLLGLNAQSVIAATVIYSQVILVRNLVVALEEIPLPVLEAARAMGMGIWQRWWWVQVPLIWPGFLAGVRLATIVAIALGTIGAKFNAGGLGQLLFEGIQTNNYEKILAGSIAVTLLAWLLNIGLQILERYSTPGFSKAKSA